LELSYSFDFHLRSTLISGGIIFKSWLVGWRAALICDTILLVPVFRGWICVAVRVPSIFSPKEVVRTELFVCTYGSSHSFQLILLKHIFYVIDPMFQDTHKHAMIQRTGDRKPFSAKHILQSDMSSHESIESASTVRISTSSPITIKPSPPPSIRSDCPRFDRYLQRLIELSRSVLAGHHPSQLPRSIRTRTALRLHHCSEYFRLRASIIRYFVQYNDPGSGLVLDGREREVEELKMLMHLVEVVLVVGGEEVRWPVADRKDVRDEVERWVGREIDDVVFGERGGLN
jgi:hypothetical protein